MLEKLNLAWKKLEPIRKLSNEEFEFSIDQYYVNSVKKFQNDKKRIEPKLGEINYKFLI